MNVCKPCVDAACLFAGYVVSPGCLYDDRDSIITSGSQQWLTAATCCRHHGSHCPAHMQPGHLSFGAIHGVQVAESGLSFIIIRTGKLDNGATTNAEPDQTGVAVTTQGNLSSTSSIGKDQASKLKLPAGVLFTWSGLTAFCCM